jgi:hypothetical protein
MTKMVWLLFIIALAFLMPAAMAQDESYPFDKYPASNIFRGRPATPILDSRKAREYRTTIRYSAKRGPDFAGHYTIADWGCGSQCSNFVVIDAITGRVYVPPDNVSFSIGGPIYRLNSTLVVTEQLASPQGPGEVDYYKWNGSNFLLLKKVHLHD